MRKTTHACLSVYMPKDERTLLGKISLFMGKTPPNYCQNSVRKAMARDSAALADLFSKMAAHHDFEEVEALWLKLILDFPFVPERIKDVTIKNDGLYFMSPPDEFVREEQNMIKLYTW